MKIKKISVDGFGVWDGLNLENVSDSITVVYGRNEAGKTTLMQFLRAMLYGAGADGRHRYLRSHDGKAGGHLDIKTRTGLYDVERRFQLAKRRGDRRVSDRIVVTSDDGVPQGAHALQILLSGVDEAIYRNVYAFGLREIQELGTLSDTDAARFLYDLSAGLDRVSLVDVLRELRHSRERLLGSDDEPSQIGQLLQRKKSLTQDLEQLRESLGRYRTLASERARLAHQIEELEQDHASLERQARVTETAFSLREKWQELQDVCSRRSKMGRPPKVTRDDVAELDKLNEQIVAQQRQRNRLKAERQQTGEQIATLPVNAELGRQGPRIEALAEQRDWIATLGSQIHELDEQAEAAAAGMDVVGVVGDPAGRTDSDALAAKAHLALSELRDPARRLKETKSRLLEYQQQLKDNPHLRDAEQDQIVEVMGSRGEQDIASALEKTGERAAKLRRRIQLDERLQRMSDQRQELERRCEDFLDREVLSPRVLIGTGIAFAVGVMLILAGWLFSSSIGSMGWLLAAVGMIGTIGAVAMKMVMENTNQRELEASEQQLKMLVNQIEEAEEECGLLDAELPRGKGPWDVQMRQTQQELAELEEMLTAGVQRQVVKQDSESVRLRADQVKRDYQEAKRDWHRALHDHNLPANLSPSQVRDLAANSRLVAERAARAERFREEARQRRREMSACTARIEDIFSSAGLEPESRKTEEKIDQLVGAWTAQQGWLEKRQTLRRAAREVRRQQLKQARELARLQNGRRNKLAAVGVDSVEAFRLAAKRYAESRRLDKQAKQLEAELTTAVGGVCSREDLDRQLEGVTPEQLERRWDGLAAKVQKADTKLKECFERRGRLGEQLLSLGNDRRAPLVQLELNSVEKQIQAAVERWRELAVTAQLLESIRRRYEQERQPAALQEASMYLEHLTEGRYVRIWTRLDEDALRVDDANGRHLSPDMLSRGTREQLFLALRLSLVAQYAQRGIRLPLVLDDVLVNFDSERAKAAAKVLRDFARLGHQILVFTCHEHIVKIFRSVKADVRELPGYDLPAVEHKPTPLPRIPKPIETREPEPVAVFDDPPLPPYIEEDVVEDLEYREEDFIPEEEYIPEEVYDDEPLVSEVAEGLDGEETWEVDFDEVAAAGARADLTPPSHADVVARHTRGDAATEGHEPHIEDEYEDEYLEDKVDYEDDKLADDQDEYEEDEYEEDKYEEDEYEEDEYEEDEYEEDEYEEDEAELLSGEEGDDEIGEAA